MVEHPSIEHDDHNLPLFTVGQISHAIKRELESAFERVRVKGEITSLMRASSGHLYFSLKDENAVLKGVCWRQVASHLAMQPKDGIEVVISGRLTTYAGRSEYQIVAENMELAGVGFLLQLLEERKKKLAAEGLFASERKQPIPFLPMVIGIVTSPTGAVIRDILHRLTDRFPCRVIVWPVLVQGEGAASQIATAIEGFNSLPEGASIPQPDVLIVARGGGSIEDLWAFNEEKVVRAAARSDIPLISAVGHETDTTLLDFVADLRAPTPTAAAEMAVPVRLDLIAQIMDARTRLTNTMNNLVDRQRSNIANLARGLPRPTQLVEEVRQRLDDCSVRLANSTLVEVARQRAAVDRFGSRLTDPRQRIRHELGRIHSEARALKLTIGSVVREKQDRLSHSIALLWNLSYLRTLERGFARVEDQNGRTVVSAKTVKPAMRLSLQFYDGKINTVVAGQKSARKHVKDDDRKSNRQGSLWDFSDDT